MYERFIGAANALIARIHKPDFMKTEGDKRDAIYVGRVAIALSNPITQELINEALEQAAKLAEGKVYKEVYVTWPWWRTDAFGNRGNIHRNDDRATHCQRIAYEIRNLKI